MNKYQLSPIGIIHSPFKDKFGVPRQAGLVPVKGYIELIPPYSSPDMTRSLEDFSHIWIIFIFHMFEKGDWSPTARPPRLGGNKRVGVFASRSPRRPNQTGLSVVKLLKIEHFKQKTLIYVEGIDLVEGTPVIDIKPYIARSDSIKTANNGWIDGITELKPLKVTFSNQVKKFLKDKKDFKKFITEVLQIDHRPAYYWSNPQGHRKKHFASHIDDLDVHWKIENSTIIVTKIIPFQKP